MNITLESLGLSKKELRALVVDRIVESVMGGDEDVESEFSRQIQAAYTDAIKSEVSKLADQKVLPKVEDILATVTFQETNRWGESEKPKLTLKEYLIQMAEKWINEPVNYEGKPKGSDSYSWTPSQSRLAHMIHQHLHYDINLSVKAALADVNSKLAVGIQEIVKLKLKETLEKLSVTTKIS